MILENNLIMLIFAGAFGACVGSFLNVVIYRLPNGKSIVTPPSACPKCSYKLRWFDNIPLISYILLMGKCRKCKEEISLRYPGVEFLTALMFIAIYATDVIGLWQISAPLELPTSLYIAFGHMAFCGALIAITFIDFDLRIIPDEISLGGAVAAFILVTALPGKFAPLLSFTEEWQGILFYASGALTSLVGAIAGAGVTWLTGYLGSKAFKKEAMGFGDVKLMLFIGAFLGWQAAIIAFFLAPFFGLLIAIPQKIITKDSYIAYGPFLSLAAITYMFLHEQFFELMKKIIDAGL